MGYSTDFFGSLKLSRPATEQERDYINLLCETRRMKRDVNKLMELYDGKHGNPFATEKTPESIYGNDGEYFVKDDPDDSIIDHNIPPGQIKYGELPNDSDVWKENEERRSKGLCQPGLWCQWRITDDGAKLEWDGGEKFYNYVEWLKYLIIHFFSKWGILLNGEIIWEGDNSDDRGKIIVKDNIVEIKLGKIVYE